MICSNFGRKSDKIVRRKELLARKWLFGHFKVRLFYQRTSRHRDPCHALRKHGPQNSLEVIKDRILQATGEAQARRMDQRDASSRFYSTGTMWAARETFLSQHQSTMDDRAARLDAGEIVSSTFTDVVVMTNSMGEGFVLQPDGSLRHLTGIKTVTFSYRYRQGVWYETTGYPNARR